MVVFGWDSETCLNLPLKSTIGHFFDDPRTKLIDEKTKRRRKNAVAGTVGKRTVLVHGWTEKSTNKRKRCEPVRLRATTKRNVRREKWAATISLLYVNKVTKRFRLLEIDYLTSTTMCFFLSKYRCSRAVLVLGFARP